MRLVAFLCLLARLLKNTWMNLDEILRVDRCRDMVTWTNWSTFEPDPDHSPDPGTGFTPDFGILAGYLEKLWTDFDEILWVDSGGGLDELIRFSAGSGL